MDRLDIFIENYDFKEYLEKLPRELIEENYKDFVIEFWKNPSVDIIKLKSKYSIKNVVSISSILMQNPIQEYYEFLEDIWKNNIKIDELINKYLITATRMDQIKFPLIYIDEDSFCPYCLGNKFNIINNIKQQDIKVECEKCGEAISYFIHKEEVDNIIEEEKRKKELFIRTLENVYNKINKIKCHRCQSDLYVCINDKIMEYNIRCDRCNSQYESVEIAQEQYRLWQQRSAMMANIKNKENELLLKTLSIKDEKDIKFKLEDIITESESIDVISDLVDMQDRGENIFKQLFNNYVRLGRLDRRLLVTVCKDCKQNENTYTWERGKEHLINMRGITYSEAVVYELMEKTKLLPIRAIIRRLMEKKLLYCDERSNNLQVHPVLIENLAKLESINKSQNINNQVAYLIFNKQKYICYHCGESGRPLKIGYLTIDKNINDLSSLVGICDSCYEDITEDEIIIDNIFCLVDERNNELGEAWKFLIQYDSSFRNNARLYDMYDEDNLIRAYANTLYKQTKDGFANEKVFFAYARAILKNSKGQVSVLQIAKEKFKLEKWLNG